MWSNGVALASKTSVKASARLCRKLQRCPIPRCFSLATKVMHIINPYTCNTLRRFVHVCMDFRSSTGRLNRSTLAPVTSCRTKNALARAYNLCVAVEPILLKLQHSYSASCAIIKLTQQLFRDSHNNIDFKKSP